MSKLNQKQKIAFLATDLFEQCELTQPWESIKAAGATPVLISLATGTIQGANHAEFGDQFKVDHTLEQVSIDDFDALVLPGGVHNPDTLRTNAAAVQFVADFVASGKPVAAICHGPWLLVESGSAANKTLTSWPSLKTDIENAGGTWVDCEVQQDGNLITSRNPDDLEAFSNAIIASLKASAQDAA